METDQDLRTKRTRFHDLFTRGRFAILGVVLAHFVLVHYFLLGFVTWDGLAYRVPPVVELLKHGALGRAKFATWTMEGFKPFVELLNVPFLALFGLDGLIFAFTAFFPLSVAAVYSFAREITNDKRTALYAAAVYVIVPVVNAQLFSGYVDWSIPGFLCFYLYALLRAGRPHTEPALRDYAIIVLATFLFTLSRQQAPYLAIPFLLIVYALKFVERRGWRVRLQRRSTVLRMTIAFLVGLAPAATRQISNYVQHGTPIYPYQFALFGLKTSAGVPFQVLTLTAGVPEYTPRAILRAFIGAWFLPLEWPANFFDSRFLGGGLVLVTALLTMPIWLRRTNTTTKVFLGAFLAASLAARDFWLPRYAYGLIIAASLCNGLALSALLDSKVHAWRYWLLVGVLGVHALRPEWDIYRLRSGTPYYRLNVSASKAFIHGPGELAVYPDVGAQFVAAVAPDNDFSLPIYGRKLTNSVLGYVPKDAIGPRCEGLHAFDHRGDNVLVIDDLNLTKHCARRCVLHAPYRCLAFKLEEGAPPPSSGETKKE